MDFSIPPDLHKLQERTRGFIRSAVIPREGDQRQTRHGPSDELRRELNALAAREGLLSPHVSPEFGGLGLELRRKGSTLTIQADGQPEFEMGHDSAGDFYPLAFDALLHPTRKPDGRYGFTWFQLGGALEAERIEARAAE